MKKLLYAIAALAVTMFVAGCNREIDGPAVDQELVEGTFTIAQPGMATKAISDGLSADNLLFYAFDENGKYLPELKPATDIKFVNREAHLTLRFVKGMKYSFVFMAVSDAGKLAYTFDTTNKTIAIDYTKVTVNDDDFDFFVNFLGDPNGELYEVKAAFNENVTLNRPLAQVNVATSTDDWEAATKSGLQLDGIQTKLTFAKLGTAFDVYTKAVTAFDTDVVVPLATQPGATLANTDYKYVAMAYVLAPAEATSPKAVVDQVKLDITNIKNASNQSIADLDRTVVNVPLQANYRTNILGDIFTVAGTFDITIEEGYADAYPNDDNQSDLYPTYDSIADLNAAFAAGSLPYSVQLVTPETGVIYLPNTADEVFILIQNDFSDNTITIKYADENPDFNETSAEYPTILRVYAAKLGTLNANLVKTHIELISGSNITTEAVIGSSNSTFVVQHSSFIKFLKIVFGSLKVEAAPAAAPAPDPTAPQQEPEAQPTAAHIETVVVEETAAGSNTVIEGQVDDLTVNAGTVEVAETAVVEEMTVAETVDMKASTTNGAALKAALEAGSKEINVTLEDNITDGVGIFIKANENKNIVLDLNGKTVEFVGPGAGSTGTANQAFHLEKGNTVTIKNGTIKLGSTASGIYMLIQNYCDLTLEDVVVDGTGMADDDYTVSNNCGVVNIIGSTSIIAPEGGCAFDACVTNYYPAGTQITVNTTGSIVGRIEYDPWGALPPVNKVLLDIQAADLSQANLLVYSQIEADAAEHIFISDAITIPADKGFEPYVFTNVATAEEYIAAMTADKQIINVKLTADIPNAAGYFLAADLNKKVVLNLNGKTLTVTGPAVGSTNTATQAFHLEKGNNVAILNGKINTTSSAADVKMLIQNYCDLKLKDVNVDFSAKYYSYALSNNFGHVTVSGNTAISVKSGKTAFDLWYGMASVYGNGVYVTFDESFTGVVNGNVEYGAASWGRTQEGWQEKAILTIKGEGTFNGAIIAGSTDALTGANIKVYGGTFSSTTWDAFKL